ncbi:MAG: D-ribose pyranase [Eubacteriales bacterium]|nr:D-ribose pyranase [Eubacteriales bacterium]
MKKDRLLNPHILEAVASLGHTEYFVIADCGLPIPKGVNVVDISLTAGVPSFTDTLKTVNSELVSESYIVASEIETVNPSKLAEIKEILGEMPYTSVPHEEFKKLLADAKCVVRTGETSSYANIILIGGVNF